MNIEKRLKALCTPAQVYFFVSMLSVLAMLTQNTLNSSTYSVGQYTVQMPTNNLTTFIFKIISILAWTYALNLLCKKGFTTVSWFLVLLPMISLFLFIALIMLLVSKSNLHVSSHLVHY